MPLAKRNDGCLECRNRRICCDKTEPECQKCVKKGIKCSGQGIECRFSSYMHAKPAEKRRVSNASKSISTKSTTSTLVSRPRESAQARRRLKDCRRGSLPDTASKDATQQTSEISPVSPTNQVITFADNITTTNYEQKAMESVQSCAALVRSTQKTLTPSEFVIRAMRPTTDSTSARTRKLIEHFSSFIAAKMVVLDFSGNGYRKILLPLACENAMVQEAVAVVSAFHLSEEYPGMRMEAEARQHRILTQLRESSMYQPNQLFNLSSWATILVLLVGDTITGSNNYIYLLELLSHLARSCTADKTLSQDTKAFIMEQTKMFEFFGFPLSSREKGMKMLTQAPEHYLGFMTSHPSLNTEHKEFRNVIIMKDIIRQACEIYKHRVMGTVTRESSIQSVEQLRKRALELSSENAGSHALVWPFFIAAAESTEPNHRKFFYEQLENLFPCTRFGTIPMALDTLKYIWESSESVSWVDIMTKQRPLLIM